MAACTYLIPVLEREGGEGCSVGKLQVGKVPVEDLPIPGRQVNITVGNKGGGRDTVLKADITETGLLMHK